MFHKGLEIKKKLWKIKQCGWEWRWEKHNKGVEDRVVFRVWTETEYEERDMQRNETHTHTQGEREREVTQSIILVPFTNRG